MPQDTVATKRAICIGSVNGARKVKSVWPRYCAVTAMRNAAVLAERRVSPSPTSPV